MRPVTLLLLVATAGSIWAAEHVRDHPYLEQYKKKTFGPKAIAMSGVRATFGEITNSPKGWGRGASGFGKRVAWSTRW